MKTPSETRQRKNHTLTQTLSNTLTVAIIFACLTLVLPLQNAMALTVEADSADSVAEGGNVTTVNGGLSSVLSNDAEAVSATLATDVNHGTLVFNSNGTFSYTHDGSENFSDSFTYTATDNSVSDTATVNITITPLNDNAPSAVGDAAAVSEGATVSVLSSGNISVLDNDTDADLPNDSLGAAVQTAPAHGTLTLNNDGTFSYAHDGSENFSDAFVYTVTDSSGATDTASVNITVTPQNDAPEAKDDGYSVDEGATLNVAATSGILENDKDAEGDALTVTAVNNLSGNVGNSVTTSHGTVTVNGDGSFAYLHDGSESLSDTFTYTVDDGNGGSSTATVNITITPITDATVSINAADALAAETLSSEASDGGRFTISLSAATERKTVVNFTVSGTATAGSDYTTLPASVTIPENTTRADIDVSVINDALLEADETVTVTLSGTGNNQVTLGSPVAASVTIADNEFTVTFQSGSNGTLAGGSPQVIELEAGSSATAPTPVGDSSPDYAFSSWSVSGAGSEESFNPADTSMVIDNVRHDITATANFGIITHMVTYTAGSNGHLEVVAGTVANPYELIVNDMADAATVTAIPDTGYEFLGWTVSAGDTSATFSDLAAAALTISNVQGPVSVSAAFGLMSFAVNATATGNGTITPLGTQNIDYGNDSTSFTIQPDDCHHIVDVRVDGVSVGAVTSVAAFTAVDADHSVEVEFALNTYTITATSGTGGSITPAGTVTVNCGDSQSFTAAPDNTAGYFSVSDLVVDGVSMGEGVDTYTFADVRADHAISAIFEDYGDSCATATSVGLNTLINGNFGSAGDDDFFRVEIPSPGGVLTLYTDYTTDKTDTYGYLLDENCNVIVFDDDGGSQRNFQIVQTLTPGIYYIRVHNYWATESGSYILNIQFETDDHGNDCSSATPITCGSTATGRIYPAGNRDYFQIDLTEAALVTINTVSGEDTYGYLLDATCSEITHDNDSGDTRNFLIKELLNAGTYYVAVRHYSASKTGEYSLEVACARSYVLTASAKYGGTISPAGTTIVNEGGSQTYTINPNSGNSIADVLVDGVSVGVINTYTFDNVTTDHTIVATFDLPPEACVDLSDMPLDVKRHGAPANIMFVTDDSGSMDWEVMTTAEDGKYTVGNRDYEYLFDLDDKIYKTGVHSHVLSGDERMNWTSQWYEFNKVYYKPSIDYEPWPTLTAADPDFPRSSPTEATPYIELSDTYHLFTGGLGEVIVDNQSSDFNFSAPIIVVDEQDPGFSKATNGQWSDGGSLEAYKGYFFEPWVPGNYQATWTPNLPDAGQYAVYVRWASAIERSAAVPYTINHSGGSETIYVNQQNDGSEWLLLGTYAFEAGSSGNVAIETYASTKVGESICADAVKFVMMDGWDWATDTDAYKEQYFWTARNGDYSANWAASLDAGEYDVYVKWVHNDTRSQNVTYTIEHGSGTSTVTVDQRLDDGGWYLLGTYNFATGAGGVTLNHHRSGINDTVCADAVKYVSRASTTIDIKNAHYYVKSSQTNKPYLVIVDGGFIRYFAVNDADGDDYIEAGELVETNDPPDDVAPTRSYLEERQNFANWFQYYRKRDLLTRYAVAQVIVTMQGVQIGVRGINGVYVQPVLKVKVGGEDYSSALLSGLYAYKLDAQRAATPLRQGLEEVGRYLDADDGDDGGIGPSPLANEEDGGECQQNFAVMFTDSYYNGLPPHVSNADGDNGSPYADSEPNTLADVAMYYYENDLADNVDNRVPVNPYDDAIHQHLVTYGVTFGVHGTMNPDDYDLGNCSAGVDCPPWPVPITAQNDKRFKIDDVWHATVNGRGVFIPTNDPDELVNAFLMVMQNIESRIGSAASVSVNGDELYGVLGTDVRMYQSSYSSDGWTGDVKAYEVDPITGEVITTGYAFSAAERLESIDWNDRVIATYNGTTHGLPFRFDDLTAPMKGLLRAGAEVDDTPAANRLQHLRGNRLQEQQHGGGFRNRYRKLGDIVHSSPVFKDDVLYAGGNDGMLHAFDAQTGAELFAYIPRLVFHNLKELTNPAYSHKFFVDLTPVVKSGVPDASNNPFTLLVGGLGKGGKGYYALDVTIPQNITSEFELSQRVLWEYPKTAVEALVTGATNTNPIVITAPGHEFVTGDSVRVEGVGGNTAANEVWTVQVSGDDLLLEGSVGNGSYTSGGRVKYYDPGLEHLGYSYSKPAVVQTSDSDRWVVLFGNGYNSLSGRAVLFVLDPLDGSVIKTIDTGVGQCNGLSSPVAVDVTGDDRLDFVYAGDLKGNLWKFDFSGPVADWDVAFYDGTTPKPLFQAKDGAIPQPITTKPDAMYHCEKGGVMVVFGTGRYLGEYDFLDQGLQTIYGIWDYADKEDPSEYLGSFERGSVPQLSNQPVSVTLLQQTEMPGDYYADNGQKLRVLTGHTPDWTVTSYEADGITCAELTGAGIKECDRNSTGERGDPIKHAGWYFDLPGAGERVPGDLMIRDGKVIAIGFTPEQTPCGSGGNSWVMELNACNGGQLYPAQFDINDDGRIDSNDMVHLTDADGNPLYDTDGNPIMAAPSGMMYPGRLLPPAVLRRGEEEIKYFSTNVGNIVTMTERSVPLGIIYWMELMQQ